MKKIIIDCDNTFGVEGCDLDDGLAIIYALGTGLCDLLGVTTTFGNNVLDVVYPNTVRFMKDIDHSHIPVFDGRTDTPENNKAAQFLVEQVKKYPKEVSIIAVGSLTNLYHAHLIDPTFFENIDELSFMGGIVEPLIICDKILNELNFSCDYASAYHVLQKGKNIKIANANICLDGFFSKERFDLMENSEHAFLRWLKDQGQYWLLREKNCFGHDGMYIWDIYAVATVLVPELFEDNMAEISPCQESLKTGMLLGDGEKVKVNFPRILDKKAYEDHVYEMFKNFAILKR